MTFILALLAGVGFVAWLECGMPGSKSTAGRRAHPATKSRTVEREAPLPFNPWAATAGELGARLQGRLRRRAGPAAKVVEGTLTSVKRVFGNASWTLIDQCTVSGGNFLLNVLLARTLPQEEYGSFALFLGAIFILRVVDYSFISYPLSVRLCVVRDEQRAGLLGASVLLAGALSLVLMATMGLGAALLGQIELMIPACLCYLCWQAQETMRRCLFADFRYREAIAGDGIAYVGQALLLVILTRLEPLTLSLTLYAMSATFGLGAVVHATRLRFSWPTFAGRGRLVLDYFSIGRWSLINYWLVLLRVQLFPWLLATMAGTAATASLQASFNIANMMNPIIFGIGNAIPQVAAQAHRSAGIGGAVRAGAGYVLFGLGPLLAICAAGVLMPDLLLRTAYGPASPYLAVAFGLQLLMVAGVLDYLAEMGSKTLLGVEAGRLAFLINVASVGVALVLALALIGPLGVLGACAALLVANSVRAAGAGIAIAWLIGRAKSRHHGDPATVDSAATPGRPAGAGGKTQAGPCEAPGGR